MSGQSHKSQWQIALQGSELGLGPVGTGLAMSLHAKSDGTGVWPSMTTLAGRVGCSRNTLTTHRATLVRLGWLVPTGGAVPRYRGAEYRLTIPDHAQNPSIVLPGSVPVLQVDHARFSETMPVLRTDHARIPCTSMSENMTSTNMSLEHELTAESTGEDAWAFLELELAAKAAAEAEELMAKAPSFE